MAEERLKSAAIIRDGKLVDGFRAHYEIRRSLGDRLPQTRNLNDEEGFVTTTGRFVTRQEAVEIGIKAKQLHDGWRSVSRELLSSDIDW